MKTFDVYLKGHRIDRVFFNSDDAEEVRESLIRWDHYDPDIVVKPFERSAEPA